MLFAACSDTPETRSGPNIFLWAWERPEDLRGFDSAEFGVAFLAQTLTIDGDSVRYRPRLQPLQLRDNMQLVAVTRIDSAAPTLSDRQRSELVEKIAATAEIKDVRAVQVDFDARASEREFYRELIGELRAALPNDIRLELTALASWCSGDKWLAGLPIDNAVPMLFDMGPDDAHIKADIANGIDWNEPLCKKSYGLSIDVPKPVGLNNGRVLYYFKSASWTTSDIEKIRRHK